MAQVVWSPASLDDLRDIVRFVRADTPTYAEALLGRLLGRVSNLETFPDMGRIVPEDESRSRRELIVDSYRIIYRHEDEVVTILRIIHGARAFRA